MWAYAHIIEISQSFLEYWKSQVSGIIHPLMLWTRLPNKLYYRSVVEAADFTRKHFHFPLPGARFFCVCALHSGEDWNRAFQSECSEYVSERRTASTGLHPKGRPARPSASRRNAYNKQGRFPGYLGGASPWGNPMTKISSLISVIFWSAERRKEKGRLEHDSSVYQASHVNHC